MNKLIRAFKRKPPNPHIQCIENERRYEIELEPVRRTWMAKPQEDREAIVKAVAIHNANLEKPYDETQRRTHFYEVWTPDEHELFVATFDEELAKQDLPTKIRRLNSRIELQGLTREIRFK